MNRPPQEQQIVLFNSHEVSAALAGVAAYAATKGAVLSLTRVMALDHAAAVARDRRVKPMAVRLDVAG